MSVEKSLRPGAILLLAVAVAGCGGDPLAGGASCVTGTVCASSAKDCAMGERCNAALNPPRCQTLFCGPVGSVCGGDDADEVCTSRSCAGGVCATAAMDFSIPVGPGDMATSGSSTIPKTGTYTGATLDPMLGDASNCTDEALEPNDTIATAITGLNVELNLQPDQASPKLQMLAICPTGPNPAASGHDVDFYEIDSPGTYATVQIFYDIKYGDLDVGIFKGDGELIIGDGSAVTNGCVATQLPAGSYYIGVVGANNTASNRYDMQIRFYSAAHACP